MKVVSALLVMCMYGRVDFALSQALQTNIEHEIQSRRAVCLFAH